jgi:putative methionine-R-sulfoxide reductase with GAF domain
MPGSAQPDSPAPGKETREDLPLPDQAASQTNSNRQSLAEQELEAALQLLVERAQYLTGATGVALALPAGADMICRASAGSSAPPAGARLEVQSGLTGESIARRQLLRCDDAENDPRVNLETCREMGIASIVVLPLLRNSEVCGLFELFSDHARAFEEHDLGAHRESDLDGAGFSRGQGRFPCPLHA